MYKNLSSMLAASSNGNAGTGVTTQEAAAHPEWYLLNTSGARFTFWGYDYLWAADIGNRGYQDRWAANVAGQAEGRRLGRRLRGRHEPDDAVPLRRRVGRQVPDRRRLLAPRPARRSR